MRPMHPFTMLRRVYLLATSLAIQMSRALALLLEIRDLLLAGRAAAIKFDVIHEDGTISEGASKMQLRDNQQFTASLAPVDKKGAPAQVQPGSVVWTGPNFIALTPSADGLSCLIVAQGIGTGQVTASADADLGDGVTTISGTLDVEVISGEATSLGITAGEVTDQP